MPTALLRVYKTYVYESKLGTRVKLVENVAILSYTLLRYAGVAQLLERFLAMEEAQG